MSQQLAHNLCDNNWRSEDISVVSEDENEVTFVSLNLNEKVLSGLKSNGFIRLSAIQLHAIPLGRCGLDLILQSKSGTGKTCVFVVIALELLEAFNSNAIQVLVICPTREIAHQTTQVMSALGSHLPNFRCCALIGGTKLKDDIKLVSKCQAVVGTPGRVKQMIGLNKLKTNSIRLFVLDECDKLLDQNFKPQIDEIFECLPQNKQMIAVSATMSTELALFLSQYMRTPVFVRLNADNPALIGVKQFYKITDCHHLNHINFDLKVEPLIEILKNISFSQCLVFSNYQTRARMLCDKLNANNWRTEYISAEKCQTERLEAITKLKKYKCRILVSTDLTARGIDVQNVNLVVNMDVPFDSQTYLHRIGRAGRFGTRGIAITIASSGREEEQLQKIIKECKLVVEELKHPIPKDIWKMDESSDELTLFQSESKPEKQTQESNQQLEDYNPFDCLDEKSDESKDSSNRLMSFNDILKEYDLLKNCLKTNDSVVCKQNYEINCFDSKSEQNSNDLINSFPKKCFISEKDLNFTFETNEHLLEKQTNIESLSSDSKQLSDICLESQEFIQTFFERKGETNVIKEDNDFNSMTNVWQNSFQTQPNVWTNALFPPISSVNSPNGYNQWIETNKNFWIHLLDPFQPIN